MGKFAGQDISHLINQASKILLFPDIFYYKLNCYWGIEATINRDCECGLHPEFNVHNIPNEFVIIVFIHIRTVLHNVDLTTTIRWQSIDYYAWLNISCKT